MKNRIPRTSEAVANILKPYNEDIKRHMGVLSEEFQDRIKVIGEQYGDIQRTLESHTKTLESHTKTLESHTKTLESHTEMIGKLATDITGVKEDVKSIKESLKTKMSRKEFVAFERRTLAE